MYAICTLIHFDHGDQGEYVNHFLICQQVKLLKIFPLKYWATMLICIMAALQSAVIGLCLDTSPASWRIGWNLQLVTILYSVIKLLTVYDHRILGTKWIVGKTNKMNGTNYCIGSISNSCNILLAFMGNLSPRTSLSSYVQSIVSHFCGDLRSSHTWRTDQIGNVRMQTIVICIVFILCCKLSFAWTTKMFCSLLGMVMIIVGLYSFLWGKRKETKRQSLPEQAKTNAELTGLQLTAAVMPTTSPDNCRPAAVEDGSSSPRGLENKQRTMLWF